MRLISLSGFARTGKDEAAKILVNQFGYERRAWADPLYRALRTLNPSVAYRGEYHELRDLIAWHGWDNIKEHAPQARELLQRLGTEVGRRQFGENFWVDLTLKSMKPDGSYVVTDSRFPNELDAAKAHGGVTVVIDRPGFGPANDHISERAWNDYDFDVRITNDGTLSDLADDVAGVLFAFAPYELG